MIEVKVYLSDESVKMLSRLAWKGNITLAQVFNEAVSDWARKHGYKGDNDEPSN